MQNVESRSLFLIERRILLLKRGSLIKISRVIFMPTNKRTIEGEKNKKITDDNIPGKEKAKYKREKSLPTINRDTPKAKKQAQNINNTGKGKAKPKKKDEEKKKR
jgi:hypothetical protein